MMFSIMEIAVGGLSLLTLALTFLVIRKKRSSTHLGTDSGYIEEIRERDQLISQLQQDKVRLETELKHQKDSADEKMTLLTEAKQALNDQFKSLSQDALKHNNESFLTLAKEHLSQFQEAAKSDLAQRQSKIGEIVTPVKEQLDKMQSFLRDLEKERGTTYTALAEQIKFMTEDQSKLRQETSNLVRALHTPSARGRWGELQLKRVVEMAGMVDRVDFFEQTHTTNSEGKALRPDMQIQLPGGQVVIVDAKTPLEAYLDAENAKDDAAREIALARHAKHLRTHLQQLGQKAYWQQFDQAPEFVIMFVPGENFFSAALKHDPSLIEAGVDNKVIPATPTTLIALLKAVAYGWRQEQVNENAKHVMQVGKDLHTRLTTFADHLQSVGGSLDKAVGHYNKAVGSFERSVLPGARKFEELNANVTDKEIANMNDVTTSVREIESKS